jgi:hypothetical protein
VFLTETLQWGRLEARAGLHGHEKLFLARASNMEGQKARAIGALDTGALADITDRAFLKRDWRTVSKLAWVRTSFHRCLDILSVPVIGSMKTSFATRVSGIQIAQRRWIHSPAVFCLNAPPSFGQSRQDYSGQTDLMRTRTRRNANRCHLVRVTAYHGVFGRHCALAAKPLSFGNVGNAVAILMYGQIAPVAVYDGVCVLAFGIITYSTSRIL